MEWSDKRALQLIDEYKRVPVLWDTNHPQYFTRIKKNDAWKSIADNMKVNIVEAQQKINSLLRSFRRERAKGKKRVATGKARVDIYISKWFAFKRMHFLLDKDDTRKTTVTDNQKNEEQDTYELPSHLTSKQDALNTESQDMEDQSPNESTTIEDAPQFTAPLKPIHKKQKLYDKNNDEKLEQEFKTLKESDAQKELPRDSFVIFSQHVANKLRSYSNNTRIQVEHAINNILFTADMGKYESSTATSFAPKYQNTYPLSNYSDTYFHDNYTSTLSPLSSPTYSSASTSSSFSNCPTIMPYTQTEIAFENL